MRDGNDNESCSRRGKSRAHLRRTERERGPFITHHVHMEQPSDIHNKAPPKSELLGPKLLLPMGCVKLGEKKCVHLPSVGEQTAK